MLQAESRDQYQLQYGSNEQITDQGLTEDNEVYQVNMPDQDLVAKTLANPEYWNKKQPIKTNLIDAANDDKTDPCGYLTGTNHYTLLKEI